MIILIIFIFIQKLDLNMFGQNKKILILFQIYYRNMNNTLYSKLLQESQKVYPQDIQCVIEATAGTGAIYVSNIEAAQNINTLKKYGIKAILTAAAGASVDHPKSQIPFYKYIPGQDHEMFDLSKYFDQCAQFIKNARKETNVLVHCMAGISRSVSLVLAHLIKHQGMTYQSSYSLVKSRRKIIHPNDGFINQLKRFQIQQRKNNISPSRQSFSPRRMSESPYQSPIKKYLQNESSPSKLYLQNESSPSKKYLQNECSPSKIYHSPSKYLYTKSPTKNNEEASNKFSFLSTTINNEEDSPHKYSALKNRYNNLSPTKTNTINFDQKDYSFNKISDSRVNLDKYLKSTTQKIYNKQPLTTQNLNNSAYKVETTQIDKKIADIRKKYADYSDQLKNNHRLNFDETVNYKPQLKHMNTMNTMNYYDENIKEDIYESPSRNTFRRLNSTNETSNSRYQKKY